MLWFSAGLLGKTMNPKFQITLARTSSHKVHVEVVVRKVYLAPLQEVHEKRQTHDVSRPLS